MVELIMAIVIVGIIFTIAIPLFMKTVESFRYALDRKDLSESADVIMRRMQRDMRRLKNAESIITATASVYEFTDIDGAVIKYSLNGTILERELNSVTDSLADNVSALTFTYYDDFGGAILTPIVGATETDVKMIEVNFTLDDGENALNYKFWVRPLNLIHLSDLF